MACHTSSHRILKLSPIFTGFAAANDLNGLSDHQSRAAMGVLLPHELRLCDQRQRKNVASCPDIFYRLGVGRKRDERLKNGSRISNSAKHDGLAAYSDTRSIRGQSCSSLALNALGAEASNEDPDAVIVITIAPSLFLRPRVVREEVTLLWHLKPTKLIYAL